LTDGKIIDGPCLSVNHILSLNGTDNIPDFVKGFDFNATAKSKLYIKPKEDMPKRELVKSARVGLAMKKKEESQTLYVMKPYRYISLPAKIKKGKIHMCLALHIEGKTTQQIQKITGAKIDSINGWIKLFNQGAKKKVKDFLGVTLDNDQIAQTIGAWAKEQKLIKVDETEDDKKGKKKDESDNDEEEDGDNDNDAESDDD
jgi:TusA-related sulfurtransferase